MDSTAYILITKFQNAGTVNTSDIMLFLVVLPILSMLLKKIPEKLEYIQTLMVRRSRYRYLFIQGSESVKAGMNCFEYPEALIAFTWYIKYIKNLNLDLKAFNKDNNGRQDPYNQRSVSSRTDFIIDRTEDYVKLEDDVDVHLFKTITKGESKYDNTVAYKLSMTLRTTNTDLQKYAEGVLDQYKKFVKSNNSNKLFHFIYQGQDKDGNLMFIKKLLSDLKNNPSYENFDCMFSEHIAPIRRDIDRLHDIGYYKRTGFSRKKGYLFYGEPGCGKTRTVVAMSNYDNRHIMEISLSRVQTNKEMEKILCLDEVCGVSFTPENLIILFEEIDVGMDGLKDRKEVKECDEDKGSKKDEIKDKLLDRFDKHYDTLNLSTILTRLDGVGNYNGVIIVATTNHKERLDPAIYRDQRLTEVKFSFSRKEDIISMIEKYYEVSLTCEQKIYLPDINSKITPAKMRTFLEQCCGYVECLEELKNFTDNCGLKE